MRNTRRLLVVALPFLAGCANPFRGSDLPTSRRLAVFRMATIPSGSGFVTRPVGEFFRDKGTFTLIDSRGAPDTCDIENYSSNPGTPAVLDFLNPGDSVPAQAVSVIQYLKQNPVEGVITLVLPPGDSLAVASGGQVTFTLMGTGTDFGAGSVTAKVAEPVALGPVDTNPSAASSAVLPLTWTPMGDDSSAVIIQLEYGTSGILSKQIFCVLLDDGAFDVSQQFLSGWRNATDRRAEITRFRTAFSGQGDQALFVTSSYNAIKTTFP
jgi:hypothetical protein